MLIEGKFSLDAPVEKLWSALHDPEVLRACMPGAEKILKIDDKTFDAVIKQKVGPIKVKLMFRNVITKEEPPTYMEMEGDGRDATKLGQIKQKTVVTLKESGAGDVEVAYEANVDVVGKLGKFGGRIMKRKAEKVEEQFTINLREKLASMV